MDKHDFLCSWSSANADLECFVPRDNDCIATNTVPILEDPITTKLIKVIISMSVDPFVQKLLGLIGMDPGVVWSMLSKCATIIIKKGKICACLWDSLSGIPDEGRVNEGGNIRVVGWVL